MSQTSIHDHPCGICTRLGACSCPYPAVSTDFVCDRCTETAEQSILYLECSLDNAEMATLTDVLHALRRDQWNGALGDRFLAILTKMGVVV